MIIYFDCFLKPVKIICFQKNVCIVLKLASVKIFLQFTITTDY